MNHRDFWIYAGLVQERGKLHPRPLGTRSHPVQRLYVLLERLRWKQRGTIAGGISPSEETLSTLSTGLSTITHGYHINFRFLVELES